LKNTKHKLRPSEVSAWQKGGRDSTPCLEANFSKRVWDWWTAIQPEGRLAFGILNKSTVYIWEWSGVSRRGANGVILVLFAMAWWGLSIKNADAHADWLRAIQDVRWALQQMKARSLQQRYYISYIVVELLVSNTFN
jgi:hypothetical protein